MQGAKVVASMHSGSSGSRQGEGRSGNGQLGLFGNLGAKAFPHVAWHVCSPDLCEYVCGAHRGFTAEASI